MLSKDDVLQAPADSSSSSDDASTDTPPKREVISSSAVTSEIHASQKLDNCDQAEEEKSSSKRDVVDTHDQKEKPQGDGKSRKKSGSRKGKGYQQRKKQYVQKQ